MGLSRQCGNRDEGGCSTSDGMDFRIIFSRFASIHSRAAVRVDGSVILSRGGEGPIIICKNIHIRHLSMPISPLEGRWKIVLNLFKSSVKTLVLLIQHADGGGQVIIVTVELLKGSFHFTLKIVHCSIKQLGKISSETLFEFGLYGFEIYFGFGFSSGFCSGGTIGVTCGSSSHSGGGFHIGISGSGWWWFQFGKHSFIKKILWIFVVMFHGEFQKFVFVNNSHGICWNTGQELFCILFGCQCNIDAIGALENWVFSVWLEA